MKRSVCLHKLYLACIAVIKPVFYRVVAVFASHSGKRRPAYAVLKETFIADTELCNRIVVNADTPHCNIIIAGLARHLVVLNRLTGPS